MTFLFCEQRESGSPPPGAEVVPSFGRRPPHSRRTQKRIEFLEKKVQTKDEVLAELMAEHIALKKSLGEL